jgi:MoxR-like ATPase
MQEYQVTLEGETLKLPDPFIVIATQNPIEYEGTFPLPEAQLDRFMIKLAVGYPTADDEQEILRRRRERQQDEFSLNAITDAAGVVGMRRAIERVHVNTDVERYMVDLTRATRRHRHVAVGASPRGGLALLKLSRAWAAMDGRDYVLPDDVKLFAHPALTHRLILEPDLWTDRRAADDVISELTRMLPVPVLEERTA